MRIFIIDSHLLFCRCMTTCLDQKSQITIVCQMDSIDDAISIIKNQPDPPTVILIDAELSKQIDTGYFCKFLSSFPSCSIVLLVDVVKEEHMLESVRIKARSCLSKNIEPEMFYSELLRIGQDESIFIKNVPINATVDNNPEPDTPLMNYHPTKIHNIKNVTKREREILQLVAYGLMDKQIALKLSISENTVKNHVKSIRQKLGASNRLQASMTGIKLGITASRTM